MPMQSSDSTAEPHESSGHSGRCLSGGVTRCCLSGGVTRRLRESRRSRVRTSTMRLAHVAPRVRRPKSPLLPSPRIRPRDPYPPPPFPPVTAAPPCVSVWMNVYTFRGGYPEEGWLGHLLILVSVFWGNLRTVSHGGRPSSHSCPPAVGAGPLPPRPLQHLSPLVSLTAAASAGVRGCLVAGSGRMSLLAGSFSLTFDPFKGTTFRAWPGPCPVSSASSCGLRMGDLEMSGRISSRLFSCLFSLSFPLPLLSPLSLSSSFGQTSCRADRPTGAAPTRG